MQPLSTKDWHYLYQPPLRQVLLNNNSPISKYRRSLVTSLVGKANIAIYGLKVKTEYRFCCRGTGEICASPTPVSYAGRKDKYAITQQWFGVHIPGNHTPDWSLFELEGADILHFTRHNKKLRTEVLRENRFDIVVRQFNGGQELNQRLTQISNLVYRITLVNNVSQ